jgi:hypothetical protein
MIPAIHSMRFAVRPSRIALMIGMPPATEPSNATMVPCLCAAEKISVPCFARRALFAVTTCLPLAIAFNTRSRASVSPPISSTMMSMSGRATISPAGRDQLDAVEGNSARLLQVAGRGHLDHDLAPRATRDLLAVAAQDLDGPLPTVPRPSSPTLMGFKP